jgi:hypothetical protein
MRYTLMAVTTFAALLGGSRGVSAQSPRVGPFDPRTGRFGTILNGEPAREADTLNVSPEQAWRALTHVYEQLHIPLTVADTEAHVLGAIRGVQRRPVGGLRLSQMLECGMGVYGPNAERYTVQLTALTSVAPAGPDHSLISTRVGGIASPNGLNSSVNCSSSGALEEKIIAMLREAVASP